MGDHPVDRHVGARFRFLRLRRGLSQTAVAERVGLTFQQVQKYERGTNRISASKLFEIASVLGVSISDFFEGLEQPGGLAHAAAPGPALSRISALDYKILALVNQVEDGKLKREVHALLKALAGGGEESSASE